MALPRISPLTCGCTGDAKSSTAPGGSLPPASIVLIQGLGHKLSMFLPLFISAEVCGCITVSMVLCCLLLTWICAKTQRGQNRSSLRQACRAGRSEAHADALARD